MKQLIKNLKISYLKYDECIFNEYIEIIHRKKLTFHSISNCELLQSLEDYVVGTRGDKRLTASPRNGIPISMLSPLHEGIM